MSTWNKKIKQKYLELIKNNIKHNEYRLYDDDMKKVKEGDYINLISTQNNDYIKVKVLSINIYKTWEDALKDHWENDFATIFNLYSECLNECRKFYSIDDVKKYGICVLKIDKVEPTYENSIFLLDTNVIIQRESFNNASSEIMMMFKWIDKYNNKKIIHEDTKNEILKYKDTDIKNTMFTKLECYDEINTISENYDDFFKLIIKKFKIDENSNIDNKLLWEVYNHNVSILVTYDKEILEKAKQLYIRDFVKTPYEIINIFEERNPNLIDYKILNIKKIKFSEINKDDLFFDSFRKDYQDFNEWFIKKNDKYAYVIIDKNNNDSNNKVKGFLYLKIEDEYEDYSEIIPKFSKLKRLKIGSFKIDNSIEGNNISERFLKIIFDNAWKYKVDEIYITMFNNNEKIGKLINILKIWGFEYWGEKNNKYNNNNNEFVYVKILKYNEQKPIKYNYPKIKENENYYFLPIKWNYHIELFPDHFLKNDDIKLYNDIKAHRFALEKGYITKSLSAKNIKIGSIVLIYRIGDRIPKKYSSVITGLGIITDIIENKNQQDFINNAKKITVFSDEELISLSKHKESRIIKLIDFHKFKKNIILNDLYNLSIIEEGSGPRPFDIVSKSNFSKILELSEKRYEE